jgi:dihydroorotate dehydrogenase electron transfer subunit
MSIVIETIGVTARFDIVGVCGACTIDPSGLRVCRDGPVFSGDLLTTSELGKYHRDATGKKIMF